jgi:hypothetical protein
VAQGSDRTGPATNGADKNVVAHAVLAWHPQPMTFSGFDATGLGSAPDGMCASPEQPKTSGIASVSAYPSWRRKARFSR